ncbi:hypothetical protein LIER_35038 [Lithospermum erythrorhizon]|uniref:Uncharacterized protein n=1 Tax=Lithospermum erythrorhizon TaxID=34254 RepID=A0AAV3NJ99_LITER
MATVTRDPEGWQKPKRGFIKLNADESWRKSSNSGAAGPRDHKQTIPLVQGENTKPRMPSGVGASTTSPF